jgi:hypothetical protein
MGISRNVNESDYDRIICVYNCIAFHKRIEGEPPLAKGLVVKHCNAGLCSLQKFYLCDSNLLQLLRRVTVFEA